MAMPPYYLPYSVRNSGIIFLAMPLEMTFRTAFNSSSSICLVVARSVLARILNISWNAIQSSVFLLPCND